ncbi:hypothetical protein BH11PLA1_BH11PLA1_17950 [soil metagenome]
MLCAVMKHWHPMCGVDFHIQVPPPPAPPIPSMPYKTFSAMCGSLGWFTTVKYFPTHNSSGFGYTMAKGTDIGPMIPHLGPQPHITLPIEMLASASKSHFGVAKYAGQDNTKADNCIAVGALGFTNPNLNCGTPMPTPTGMIIVLNTHMASMTLGDFLAGCIDMGVDFLIQWGLNKLGDVVAGGIARALRPQYFASRAAAKAALPATVKGAERNAAKRALFDKCNTPFRKGANEAIDKIMEKGVGTYVVGFFMGSPTGMDVGAIRDGNEETPLNSGYGAATNYLSPSTTNNPKEPPPVPAFYD